MNTEKLIATLRELEQRGWPLQVELFNYNPTTGVAAGAGVQLEGWKPEVTISFDQPLHWAYSALLTGFLVSQLEARGYRREVEWQLDGDGWMCGVEVYFSENYYKRLVYPLHGPEYHESELSGLISACLALPVEVA
jgi:hypothetical protein